MNRQTPDLARFRHVAAFVFLLLANLACSRAALGEPEDPQDKRIRAATEYWENIPDRGDYQMLDQFIILFPESPEARLAFSLRYELVRLNQDIDEYNEFIDTYRDRVAVHQAIHEVYLLYEKVDELGSYFRFLSHYPRSPESVLAQGRIYAIAFEDVEKSRDVSKFDDYIRAYPRAPQVQLAALQAQKLCVEMEQSLRERKESEWGPLNTTFRAWREDKARKLLTEANLTYENLKRIMRAPADKSDADAIAGQVLYLGYKTSRLFTVIVLVYDDDHASEGVFTQKHRTELINTLRDIEQTIKLEHERDREVLSVEFARTRESIDTLHQDLSEIKGILDQRLSAVENTLQEGFTNVSRNLDVISAEISLANRNIEAIDNRLERIEDEVHAANNRLDVLHRELNKANDRLRESHKTSKRGWGHHLDRGLAGLQKEIQHGFSRRSQPWSQYAKVDFKELARGMRTGFDRLSDLGTQRQSFRFEVAATPLFRGLNSSNVQKAWEVNRRNASDYTDKKWAAIKHSSDVNWSNFWHACEVNHKNFRKDFWDPYVADPLMSIASGANYQVWIERDVRFYLRGETKTWVVPHSDCRVTFDYIGGKKQPLHIQIVEGDGCKAADRNVKGRFEEQSLCYPVLSVSSPQSPDVPARCHLRIEVNLADTIEPPVFDRTITLAEILDDAKLFRNYPDVVVHAYEASLPGSEEYPEAYSKFVELCSQLIEALAQLEQAAADAYRKHPKIQAAHRIRQMCSLLDGAISSWSQHPTNEVEISDLKTVIQQFDAIIKDIGSELDNSTLASLQQSNESFRTSVDALTEYWQMVFEDIAFRTATHERIRRAMVSARDAELAELMKRGNCLEQSIDKLDAERNQMLNKMLADPDSVDVQAVEQLQQIEEQIGELEEEYGKWKDAYNLRTEELDRAIKRFVQNGRAGGKPTLSREEIDEQLSGLLAVLLERKRPAFDRTRIGRIYSIPRRPGYWDNYTIVAEILNAGKNTAVRLVHAEDHLSLYEEDDEARTHSWEEEYTVSGDEQIKYDFHLVDADDENDADRTSDEFLKIQDNRAGGIDSHVLVEIRDLGLKKQHSFTIGNFEHAR